MKESLTYEFTKGDCFVEISPRGVSIPADIEKRFEDVKKIHFSLSPDWNCHQEYVLSTKPTFFEWQSIDTLVHIPNSIDCDRIHLMVNGILVGSSKKVKENLIIHTNIKFKNAVGHTIIEVVDDNRRSIFRLETEIFPQKIDYKEDYEKMMEEITSIIYNLAFDFLKQTHSLGRPRDSYVKSLNEFISILQVVYEGLEKSLDQILRNPKSKINQEGRVKEVSQVKKVDKRIDKWIQKKKQFISSIPSSNTIQVGPNSYVSHLPEQKKRVSYDTFENQFIVWATKDILSKLDDVIQNIKSSHYSKNKGVSEVLHRLNSYKSRLRFRLADQLLKEVSPFNLRFHFSTTLTMGPGYKDFYHRYLLLRKGLSISDNDIFRIDNKEISTIYEYWCFLKIIDTLKRGEHYEFESSDLIKVEHKKFVVNLRKGRASTINLTRKETGEKLSVSYNRNFSKESSTFNQIPDNIIEFSRVDYSSIGQIKKPFKYVLDAKYRFDKQNNEESSDAFGPPQDAIGQLHRYRDAMSWKTGSQKSYGSVVRNLGGVILFPYPLDEERFRSHKFYTSISEVNIGAIPLHPGSENKLFEEFLNKLFSAGGDELLEQIEDFDKSPLRHFEESVRTPVLVGMIKNNKNQARMDFLKSENLFYVHKSSNANLFSIKRLLIYNQGVKKIVGLYRVKRVFFDLAEHYDLIDPTQNEYLFYKVELIDELDVDFSLSGFGRSYFFTNQFAVDNFISTGNVDFLKVNSLELARKVRKLNSENVSYSIVRNGQFILDDSGKDQSKSVISIDVVCAIIRNDNGEVLIAKKAQGKSNEGLWEFPGGKVHKQESFSDAIKREIMEELNMGIEVISEVGNISDHSGTISINLIGLNCKSDDTPLLGEDHDQIRFVSISELKEFEMCIGDHELHSKFLQNK